MIGQWRFAVARSTLPATARHVALTLAIHAEGDGAGARPSVATLAQETGRKRDTVMAALDELDDAGYIDRERPSRRRATRYTLTLPSGPSPGATEMASGPHTGTTEWSPNGSRVVPLQGPSGPSIGAGTPQGLQKNSSDGAEAATEVIETVASVLGVALDRQELTRHAATAVAAGWSPEALADHLVIAYKNGDERMTDGVQRPTGFLRRVFRDLPDPPHPASVRWGQARAKDTDPDVFDELLTHHYPDDPDRELARAAFDQARQP